MAKTTNFRSDLGPLTTTFTPPVDCTGLQFIRDNVVGLNLVATNYCYPQEPGNPSYSLSVIDSCFPEGFASFFNAISAEDNRMGLYSPGSACPSGYTVACAHSRSKGQSNPFEGKWGVTADSSIWDLLRDGETATACCPFGYGCHQIHPSVCWSNVGYIWVPGGVRCPGTLTPTTTLSWAETALAMRVIVIHAATTDQTATRKATSSAAISSAPTSRAPNPSVPASSVPSKSSLPKPTQGPPLAAKIAIGVAIPLVAILTGAACFFIFRYRRKRRLSQEMHELGQDARGNGGDDQETPKPELPGDAGMASAGQNEDAFRKAELDAIRHCSGGAVELAAEVAGGGIPELYSSSSPRELDSTSKAVSVVDLVGHDVDTQHVDERSRGLWQWSDYQD